MNFTTKKGAAVIMKKTVLVIMAAGVYPMGLYS